MTLTEDEVMSLIGIGFCQPKFYKPVIWRKAKKLMDDVVCANNLARPFNFGRGKGKYTTDYEIEEVKEKTISILKKTGRLNEPTEPDMTTQFVFIGVTA